MPCRFLAQLVMLEENPPFFSASFFWILFQLYFIIPLNDSPRDIKKWSGYKSLKLKSVKMTSHENDPLSTKSPLNSCGFVKEKCIFKPPPPDTILTCHTFQRLQFRCLLAPPLPTPSFWLLLTPLIQISSSPQLSTILKIKDGTYDFFTKKIYLYVKILSSSLNKIHDIKCCNFSFDFFVPKKFMNINKKRYIRVFRGGVSIQIEDV